MGKNKNNFMQWKKKTINEMNRRTFDVVDGRGAAAITTDFTVACMNFVIDLATDLATMKTLFQAMVVRRLAEISHKKPELAKEIDEIATTTAIDSWTTHVLYGAAIITAMKQDYILRRMTRLTPSDATANVPWTPETRAGFMDDCKRLYFNPLSFSIAHIWSTLIQVCGAENASQELGKYVMPVMKGATAATMNTLIAAMDAELYPANVARVLGQPLRVVNPRELESIDVVPALSALGMQYASFLPFKDGDASVVDFDFNGSSPSALTWLQGLGLGPDYAASVLLREISSAEYPAFLAVSTVSAGKLSILYVNDTDTAWTQAADTVVNWDWIYNVASGESRTHRGIMGSGCPTVMTKATPYASGTAWNELLQDWLFSTFDGKYAKTPAFMPVMDDMLREEFVDNSVLVYRNGSSQALELGGAERDRAIVQPMADLLVELDQAFAKWDGNRAKK